MGRHDDDDHARFERPRRRTRPRTKERPDYSGLPLGRVVTVDRGRYSVRLEEDRADGTGDAITAAKARSIRGVVVGDLVRLDGDVTGAEGTLSRIAEVLPRTTVLRRTADDDDPIERIVVANADQLVVVAALADPPPRPALIDRCLVAAFVAGMDPLVILTKSDLASPDEMIAALEPLDVAVLVIGRDADLAEVRASLADRISVLVGHSGVGKSTLVNQLVPDAFRTTSHVNAVTGRGRHTSTGSVVLDLPGGGRIVDTPGFRSFGLAHVEVEDVLKAFTDLHELTRDCPRGCTHLVDEPECAMDVAVADGRLSPARLASFRRILESREQV
ncbi:ribosome small subunit-dependent GTPase A [Aeromicrobium alkaliterrae]|uniref:Small ribosomal subunit biogenesis GTPase RsgA n=1 Tax=Aeromicrobium alkaliterrae TaxID=302168 RepID=A0ABN2JFU2_9ACTN